MPHLTTLPTDSHTRAVLVHGRYWTWSDVEAAMPFRASLAVERRSINAARFDRHHPYLGYLLAGELVEDCTDGGEAPEVPPIPPLPPPIEIPGVPVVPPVVPPISPIPEPSSFGLAGLGLGLAAAGAVLMGRGKGR